MADIHILVADDAAGQRLDAYLAPMTAALHALPAYI